MWQECGVLLILLARNQALLHVYRVLCGVCRKKKCRRGVLNSAGTESGTFSAPSLALCTSPGLLRVLVAHARGAYARRSPSGYCRSGFLMWAILGSNQ